MQARRGTSDWVLRIEGDREAGIAAFRDAVLGLSAETAGVVVVSLSPDGAASRAGLRPGPLLFTEHPDFVWGLIGSLYVANAFTVLINLAFISAMLLMDMPSGHSTSHAPVKVQCPNPSFSICWAMSIWLWETARKK